MKKTSSILVFAVILLLIMGEFYWLAADVPFRTAIKAEGDGSGLITNRDDYYDEVIDYLSDLMHENETTPVTTPPKSDFKVGETIIITGLSEITDLPTAPPITEPPVTNPPVTNPPSNENHQATNPPATNPPSDQKSGKGQTMTSEGPLFLSFRNELTEELWMFTPMDLALDGDYHFSLIGNASQVVGEAKVVVRSGMVIVTYLVVNGVQVNTKNEFFTFFPDIRGVPSVKPSQLQHVKLTFGIPYSVAGWLNSDPNVLLYINCPVSYKTNLPGLMPFSFQDPAYLQRMMELLPLMD